MKVAIQIDYLTLLNLETDTSLALAYEAGFRGWEVFYYHPDQLFYKNNNIYAFITKISVKFLNDKFSYEISEGFVENLENFDFILIRQNPPFDMNYITNSYLLSKLKRPKIINNPKAIINCSEKIFLLNFPELIAPTLITKNIDEAKLFIDEYNTVVLKPLYAYGGQDVLKLSKNDNSNTEKLENFAKRQEEYFIVQKFLPEVEKGDKRIILINGKFAGIINRVPLPGSIKSNLVAGGTAEKIEPNERDIEICETISESLVKNGIFLAGIDVIGNYLNEINITSPTGFLVIRRLYGKDLAKKFWDEISTS